MKNPIKQISSKITSLVCALFACLSVFAIPNAFAANAADTWVGNTSANLNDLNWTGGNNPPIVGDDWVFGTAGTAGAVLNNNYGGGISVSNILFGAGASAFTFTSNPITVTQGSITNSSTALQTFNGNVVLAGASNRIVLNAGGGDITIGGILTNTASLLNVAGAGNLTLTNVNTAFTSQMIIGTGSTLTISGAGAVGAGSAGNYSWVNAVAASTNNGLIVYSSSVTNEFNPKMDGTGGVIVNGPGVFRASAANSAGWSGPLVVNGGIFSDPKPQPANGRSGFGDTGGPNGFTGVQNRTATANNGGIISIDANGAFDQAPNQYIYTLAFIINTNSLMRVTTGTSIICPVFLNGGALMATNGSFVLGGTITTGGGLKSSMLSSNGGFNFGSAIVGAGYQAPFVVNPTPAGSGAGGDDLYVEAALRNGAAPTGFTLSGGGTMHVVKPSIFTGPVSITQGKLILGNPLIPGDQTVWGTNGDFLGNITISSNATFVLNTPLTNQIFEGVLSGAGGGGSLIVSPGVTLSLGAAAITVSRLNLVISNTATLDVTQTASGSTLGSTVMGFGTINGNATTAAGALLKGGIPGTFGTLAINGDLNMAVGAVFDLALGATSGGLNSQVTVSGSLIANGTQVHLTAPSTVANLDMQNYTLVTSASLSGSVSTAPIWDVKPANANHYYVTNINNNVVLAYSSVELPIPSGSSSPANVLRNQNALLVATAVPGSGQTIASVTVDASSLGGSSSLALVPNGVANTFTNSVLINAGQAPGVYFLPATAIDTTPTTGNGIVVVNVIASTEVWAGLGGNQNFDTAVNWAVQPGQTAAYPPASSGDWLSFAGSANLSPVINQSYSVNGLTFTNGAGAFNLTASGGNVLTLAEGGGVTNLSANTETVNLPILSTSAGPTTFSASNGNLTMSGGFADNNGGLAVSGSMNKTFTLAGANTFTGPLLLNRGTMALATSLTETYRIWVPQLANSTGILNVISGGNLAVVDGTNMTVAPQGGAIGAMSVSAGGSVNIPSGTLTLGSSSGSTAYFNIIGGDVVVGTGISVASLGDKARFDMSGGTCTLNNNLMRIGTGTGQPMGSGEVNFSGGTYNSLNAWTTAGLGGGIFVGENGTGVLNISGNALVNVWGETNMVIGVNTTGTSPGFTALGKGTVNLLGGTLVTAQIVGGTGPSSVFNFNGGTVSNYTGGISYSGVTGGPGPYFMYNVLNTYVYSGGAIIDDGGGSIAINEALQAPSGYGMSTITITNGGSGYFAPPSVTISGGSGTGATASAVISGGSVTAINVTCPGTGYALNDKLTFTVVGGGGTGAGATNLITVPNRSGGLTYSSLGGAGTGTLTLIGASTYTNTTVIKSGTLQLGVGGSINNSAVIAISNNATFDVSPAGGGVLNVQLLKGFGTVNGVLTAKAGSMIYPGNDPAVGTLTFNNGGLNMAAGSAATFNLSTSAAGANDQVVINGASSSLIFANNTIHIKVSNPGSNMDTVNPYILIQNNSSVNRVGLPSTAPVFDVAPLNVGSGFWLIQPSGNNLVLLNSSVAPPGGLASVTAGAINGTNVVRNTTITVSVGVSGPNIQTVTVDLSGYGGAVTPLTQVGATTNWTGSVTIPPGLPPGPFNLPIVAYDGNLYGGVPLPLNALPTAVTWNGANFISTPNTDNNGNWAGAAAPGYVGDTAIFAGSTGLQPVFNQNYTFNNIVFTNGAGSFVLNSSVGSIGITGGVTNNSANVETLNIPLTIAGTVFSGASGNLVLSNTLSGSGLLNVGTGAGGVTINGTDAHTGNTLIANGGSLVMGPFGVWQDLNSNQSYSGSTSNSGTFVYNSPLDQTIAGVISGPGGIIVNGPGGLTLSANNSFTGNLTISNSTVHDPVVQNANAPIVSGLGNPQNGKTNIINNGGILSLEASGGNEFGNGSTTPLLKFIINQGGVVRITSGNATMGPITLNGGTLSVVSSASTGNQFAPYELQSITVGGTSPSKINYENDTRGNSSGVNLTINAGANSQMPINVASTGSSSPDLVVSTVMINSGNSQSAAGFNKAGTGTMEMTAVNIFTGPITVGNGTVLLDGDSQLGGGVYPGNMVISNGAAFIFASTQIQTNLGTLAGAGTLVVSNTTGPGLILSNANSMTGPIAIKAGTLTLLASALPNTSSGISIARGATLDVSQRASPYVWPAVSSLTASGNAASPALINSAGAVNLSNNAVILAYDNTSGPPQPALNINGSLSLGTNAFTVNTVNGLPLADGDYVLIQATGTVTDGGNYPSVTGTAIGSGKRGSIAGNGSQVILTISPVSTVPPSITYSLNGPVLTLSWPSDHLGYILQSNAVNLAVSSNWFNIPGSSSVTSYPITVQTVKTNVFFRLILP